MATVPDPWMRRTRVATMKGIRMGEMGSRGDLLGQLLACATVAGTAPSAAGTGHQQDDAGGCSPSSRRAAVACLSMCGTRV